MQKNVNDLEIMFNNQEEIDFLYKHLSKDKDVLEWGSGRSTIEIARRVRWLLSIENNKSWADSVTSELNKRGLLNAVVLIRPANNEEATGTDGNYEEYEYYITSPSEWQDANDENFDVIFIDGRARVECAREAVSLLKPGGIILIHDIMHPEEKWRRREYDKVLEFLDHVEGVFTLHSFKPKAHRSKYPDFPAFHRPHTAQNPESLPEPINTGFKITEGVLRQGYPINQTVQMGMPYNPNVESYQGYIARKQREESEKARFKLALTTGMWVNGLNRPVENIVKANIESIIKHHNAMEQTEQKAESQDMCWYQDYVIDEMNRFYDQYIKGHDIAEHMRAFTNLLKLVEPKDVPLLDLGTGTAMISEFTKEFQYSGSDLPKVLSGCAMRNYPQYMYKAYDILDNTQDSTWIEEFPVVVANGFIDIMGNAINVLQKLLSHTSNYLLIHRQEITEEGQTREIVNGSYGGKTYHSIFSRKDFNELIDKMSFDIIGEESCPFPNWENGGSSFLLKRRRSYALSRIDHKLYEKYFNKKQDGIFIEAGANDGLRQTNTLYFEEYKNWSGILIEPIRENWKLCKENRSRVNIIVNAALISDQYNSTMITMGHFPQNNGLMSCIKGMEEEQQKRITYEYKKFQIQDVKALSLNSILQAIWDEEKPIDLLSLDVEGYEYEALSGIDFKKWQINFLLIELRDVDTSFILDAFLLKDYDFIEKITDQDYLYKKKVQNLGNGGAE